MTPFNGFSAGKTHNTPIPAQFFTDLLPQIDDLDELKVTLYVLWALDRQEGSFRCLRWADFAADEVLLAGLSGDDRLAALRKGLIRAVQRGTLLQSGKTLEEAVFFINTPRGRAGLKALEAGEQVLAGRLPSAQLAAERPNIFRLYEENIGPLTPIIADRLKEAEELYPPEWINEAVHIAVERNVRNWRYIEGILRKWQEEGRDGTTRKPSEEDRRRYVEGEFGDYVQH